MLARFYDRARGYITGGLLIALGITSLGWYIADNKREACQLGREKDQANYAAAQAEAKEMWIKEIVKKEKEYAQKAKKADEAYDALVGKYNDAIRVYVQNTKGRTGSSVAPADGGSAEGSNGSGENPFIPKDSYVQPELDITEVTVVPVSDLLMCAENTARLVIARDWALGLNE